MNHESIPVLIILCFKSVYQLLSRIKNYYLNKLHEHLLFLSDDLNSPSDFMYSSKFWLSMSFQVAQKASTMLRVQVQSPPARKKMAQRQETGY